MCKHAYTANYKSMPGAMGKQCPYPEFYKKARSTDVGASLPALPIDDRGKCIFHSGEIAWKRDNDFEGHFLQLVRLLIADPATKHYDFEEFVFVGSKIKGGPETHTLHLADTIFPQQAYFIAARFLDSFTLERVEFRGGANFRLATFAGDLCVTSGLLNGIDFTRTEFGGRVLFTKVDITSYAFLDNANFNGTAGTGPTHGVRFEDSRFDGLTTITGAAFVFGDESSVLFLRTRFDDSVDFTGTRFQCQVIFTDVSFAGATEFVDTSFETIGSSARYRGSAVEFNRIEVGPNAVLTFKSTDPQKKLFDHDVQMSFKDEPAGQIGFQNVNFKNLSKASRDRLTQLARVGKVEIGSGCIKYRFQTPVAKIDVSESNAPLILKLCETFTHYFTVSNGINLGLEVVERTSANVQFFYFTDEDISEATFYERLAVTERNMWSLLSVRSEEQFLERERSVRLARATGSEDAVINAVDCVTAMIAIFFGAGIRIARGMWSKADTMALQRAVQFGDGGPEIVEALHVVLVDRYTGATLFDINGQQHARLPPMILAYRDEPRIEVVDVAILTAIEVERKAVCEAFGLTEDHRVRKDSRVYWRGKLPLNNRESYEVVVAQAPDPANIDTAILATDLFHHWKPGAALLVGIAASTDPGKIRLGDVVLGSEVYYYERGKVTSGGTRPEPKIISADATIWSNVTALPDWDGKVVVERPDGTESKPKVHQGVIASGEKVIADAAVRDEMAAGHRKIVAIEMEGYGFSRAVWQSFEHVRHLDIRAICDDGSKDKDDRWHAYAAAAAAGFAKHFLLDRPLAPKQGGAPWRS